MGIVRALDLQPGALSVYSDSGQIPAYAVTSALVPISSNSGVSHSMAITSMAITSFHMDFIVQAPRVLTTMAQRPLRTEPETFLLVRWVACLIRHPAHQTSVLIPAARRRRERLHGAPRAYRV